MKTFFLSFILINLIANSLFAQEVSLMSHPDWNFKYELIKPHGKIDHTSYFLITLENKNDTTMIIPTGRNPILPLSNMPYYRFEYLLKDGTTKLDDRLLCIGEYNGKSVKILNSKNSIQIKSFLFMNLERPLPFDDYGLFKHYSFYQTVAKVRIRLERFTYIKKNYNDFGKKIPLLVTDWVDITGSDFNATMQLGLRRKWILP